LLERLRPPLREHSDLEHSGALSNAYQEYAEALILLNLQRKESFPSPKEIGVPSIPYVLGLADVIGELRRRAVDALRSDDLKTAEKSLSQMEQIYLELLSLESAYSLTPQLRRKCDVARHLIEATRGEIAVETRRSQLEKAIGRLEKTIRRERKIGRTTTKEDT
jgi:translin